MKLLAMFYLFFFSVDELTLILPIHKGLFLTFKGLKFVFRQIILQLSSFKLIEFCYSVVDCQSEAISLLEVLHCILENDIFLAVNIGHIHLKPFNIEGHFDFVPNVGLVSTVVFLNEWEVFQLPIIHLEHFAMIGFVGFHTIDLEQMVIL
jgi:hypothetical protein